MIPIIAEAQTTWPDVAYAALWFVFIGFSMWLVFRD